ncbi:hypothetical protein [Mycoplasmopsis fermentans]|uniref:Lipoprotein n=2 Tax=Mycoplasmopsis fermentans TaxID=2115 RepID=C4XEY0_MYCFP|nr:hypothetical protein [Mycoplasmopsis fermentans]VEU66712.1 Uncharacterised protein [Mesomycoplasma conjunctivae]ADN69008.1 hypothetical membrane spanning protein [Mycoplasmopsis fermentans JER]ADV34517.1 Hypothetical Protein MfeM64YM_0519 [Mycoplasmopsis fermentans M64]VEU64073.1 Uncharacterised protein [Mycoplasmopsis fermentans]BAH69702.1 hypothetical protein MBIO_0437 [Mycoplasmopsis fermentans PG18]
MFKKKLLISSLAVASFLPVSVVCVSCGDGKTDEEKYLEAAKVKFENIKAYLAKINDSYEEYQKTTKITDSAIIAKRDKAKKLGEKMKSENYYSELIKDKKIIEINTILNDLWNEVESYKDAILKDYF